MGDKISDCFWLQKEPEESMLSIKLTIEIRALVFGTQAP